MQAGKEKQHIMRSAKSRSRNKSNRNRSVGNITNRVFESSGPEGKVRGTPAQIIEKYNQLARDAQLANDWVAAENFRQHAEHYTRLLSEAQREIEARREQQEAQQRERQQNRGQRDGRRGGEGRAVEGVSAQASDPLAVEGVDPAQSPQPDVLGVSPLVAESVIVDTPESRSAPDTAAAREKPRRKARARKPRADDRPESGPEAGAGDADAGDAGAEGKAPQAEGNAPKPEAPEAAE